MAMYSARAIGFLNLHQLVLAGNYDIGANFMGARTRFFILDDNREIVCRSDEIGLA